MIILLHPQSTKPKNRRFPLAALALAAVLEGKEEYAIVDGNADAQPEMTLDRIVAENVRTPVGPEFMAPPEQAAA